MNLFLVPFCVLCIIGEGLCANIFKERKREGFSIIGLPFKYHKIVSDFIDYAPKELLQVNWPNGVSARLGNELTPSETKDIPTVLWDCNRGSYYTLVMFDCDVLGQKNRLLDEGRLWLVGNIHNCDVNKGETIIEMLSPVPLYGSGKHRYVILLYKQTKKLVFEEPKVAKRDVENRFYTSMRSFAIKYDLKRPIAGNFFLSEWDTYVDAVFATLKQPFPAYITRAIALADLPQRTRFIKNFEPDLYEEIEPSQFEQYGYLSY